MNNLDIIFEELDKVKTYCSDLEVNDVQNEYFLGKSFGRIEIALANTPSYLHPFLLKFKLLTNDLSEYLEIFTNKDTFDLQFVKLRISALYFYYTKLYKTLDSLETYDDDYLSKNLSFIWETLLTLSSLS